MSALAGTAECTCDVCRVDTGAITTQAHDDGTPYGVIGTHAWQVDNAARVDAAYGVTGKTHGGWSTFDHVTGVDLSEPCEQRVVTGIAYEADSNGTPDIATRRYVALARRYGAMRRARAATMAAARARHTVALAAARAAHGTVTLLDWRYLPRRPRPLDKYDALHEWVDNHDAEHRAWVVLTSHAASGDGRGTVDHAPNSVNGTETRVAPRWHGTPRVAVMTTVETRNGIACVAPVDWRCYRVAEDGTRTPLVSTATARKRKAAAVVSKAAAARADRDAAARERLAARLAARGAAIAAELT